MTDLGAWNRLLSNASFVLFAHIPNDNMVMRHVYPWVPRIVVKRHVIVFLIQPFQVKLLLVRDVLDRDHVDSAYKPILPVVCQKWPAGKSVRFHVQNPNPGKKAWEVHKRADLLVPYSLHHLAVIEARFSSLL